MTSYFDSLRDSRIGRAMTPFYWREALLCVPGLPLVLVGGAVIGDMPHAAAAAGAAFSVGFGAARGWRQHRWGAMLIAALGMTVAAFLGTWAGQWFGFFIFIAAASAASCAALALIEEDTWWVVLQVVIALLVAGYYPGDIRSALQRALAVLIGGAVQLGTVIAMAALVPRAGERLPGSPHAPAPNRRLIRAHVLRAAASVALASLLARELGLANSYWAPMTAMLVLKPHLHETQIRGLARLAGTVAGCAAATLFVFAIAQHTSLLLAGVTLTAGFAFAAQKAHYATLSCAITATVVLLLSFGHGGVLATAEHRLICTLLGGVVALTIARIAPHQEIAVDARTDRVGQH